MLGVILSGGESTRMGRDKGLIIAHNQTWVGSAMEKMAALGIPVVVSINARQLPEYTQLLANEQRNPGEGLIPGKGLLAGDRLIPDNPALTLKGPLAGILSVHLQFPTEDLFVLACDLPLMDPTLLKDLYLRHQQSNAQAYLYTNAEGPEPLCGIYTTAGLARIIHRYRTGELARHSMKYALDQLTVDSRPIPEDKKQCFQNFNYPNAS